MPGAMRQRERGVAPAWVKQPGRYSMHQNRRQRILNDRRVAYPQPVRVPHSYAASPRLGGAGLPVASKLKVAKSGPGLD